MQTKLMQICGSLLQVTKGFGFQKNKNVCFVSGNFSSDRFSYFNQQAPTISVFIEHIEMHVTNIC